MAAQGQDKTPTEIIPLAADFGTVLLSGESINLGNINLEVKDALTDEDVESSIVVPSSFGLSGSVLSARFQGGVDGKVYSVVFRTGATNFLNSYDADLNLIITKYPAGNNLYSTLADVKDRLGILQTDTSEDRVLSSLLLSASRYLRARFGREILLRQFSERFYLDHTARELRLPEYPVRSIDSITFSSPDESETSEPDLGSYDFTEDGTLFFRHSFTFWRAPSFNTVIWRAGFDKVPEDVAEACAKATTGLYRAMSSSGLSEEKIGDYAYKIQSITDMPKAIRAELADPWLEAIIGRYRRYDMTEGQPARPERGLGANYLR